MPKVVLKKAICTASRQVSLILLGHLKTLFYSILLYQLTTLFSTVCGCNKDGSENDACHKQSGMCNCQPGWYGQKCQKGK